MFIQSIKTPNPDAMKFFPGGEVMSDGAYEFLSQDSAESSPLAAALFRIDGVAQVFYGNDFISVTKDSNFDWSMLKPQIIMAILNYYKEGDSLFSVDENGDHDILDVGEEAAGDDPSAIQIVVLLKKYVVPRLAADGGHVEFKEFKDGIVYLKLRGACTSCPSSSMTLKHGIKSLLCAYMPEVIDVEQVI